jgi:sugar/nucleoside kinase (ribokinase family)
MYDIISIGSSIVDSFIKSKLFKLQKSADGVLLCQTYGDKIDVDEYLVKTGGGGSNTAVGFSRMGYKTGVVTETGKDSFADFILGEFRKEFVSTNLVISEKNEKTGGSIILLGDDGGRTVLVHRGASAQLDPKDIPAAHISRAKWVHLSSIAGQYETLKFIFEVIRDSETKLSWNPGNKELQLLADGKIDPAKIPVNILFVNRQEWMKIESVQQQILGQVQQVIITNGSQGGEVYYGAKPNTKFFSGQTKSIDDTGAGDSFVVGYVTAHLKGRSIIECCAWGKKNAESVISHVGAKPGLLTIDKIDSHNG